MISWIRRMLACHRSARHIDRYLDADPAAPLTPAEARRLEAHLAVCAMCSTTREEHQALRQALSRWSQQRLPDAAVLARLHDTLDRISVEGVS